MADNPCCTIWWEESHDVIRTAYLPGAVCGLGEAQAIYAEIDEIGGRESPMCVDMRCAPTVDRAARRFFMEQGRFSAVAMLVDSAVTRMLATFFLNFNRSGTPTQMFTDEAKALAWLREHP